MKAIVIPLLFVAIFMTLGAFFPDAMAIVTLLMVAFFLVGSLTGCFARK